MSSDQKYEVGDIVRIEDVTNCIFGFTPEMERLRGCTAAIIDCEWAKTYHAYHYTIDEDNGEWWWDESCFRLIRDSAPEFEVESIDSVMDFLMKG